MNSAGRPYYAARSAIINVAYYLREEFSQKTETQLAHSWLFPSLADHLKPLSGPGDMPPQPNNILWKDSNLNFEQMVGSLVYSARAAVPDGLAYSWRSSR